MSRRRYEILTTAYDKKGLKICEGVNNYEKSHPWQKELSISVGLSEERTSLHSELNVLLRSAKTGKKVHTLKVERYDKAGMPKLAFPCASCQEGIRLAGVKEVLFTTEEGYQRWKVQ